jgi:putative transposase
LVNDAVLMASESRPIGPGSIIHSDHGSQFTSWAFSELIRTKHLTASMGTVGDCYDNATMESFWGTMQIELLNRKKWRTKIELSIAIAEWIEHWYNPERLHSRLDYLPPVEFEALHSMQTQT